MFGGIVFSGGAVPAMSFFGCLQYLEHVGLLSGITTYVGSSAGAIVAFMSVLGFTPREACEFIMKTGVQTHLVTEVDIMGALFGQQTCLDTLGCDDGMRWMAFLADALEAKRGCRDITFSDLAKATGKVFVVCVTNLTKVRREYLSVDTHPLMSALLAVRMSTSVPLLYVPVVFDGCIYVDGSVLDNCPVASSAASKGGPPTTLVLSVLTETPEVHDGPVVPTLFEYLSLLMGAVMSHAQSNNGNTPGRLEAHITRVAVPVPSSGTITCGFNLRSFTFDLTQECLDDLVSRGYAAARLRIEPILLATDDTRL